MAHQDLDDYKLETTFHKNPDYVVHTLHTANWARGERSKTVKEKWASDDEILGSGTFGTVRLEKRVDEKDTRAVKQLWKLQMTRLNIDYKKELLALTKFSRSKFQRYQVFVIFLGWFEDKDSIYLAMEYFPHGTLDKYISIDLQEVDARIIALQLLEGLKLMHEEGFTHRDLKPQNIFVAQRSPNWWVKIGDFGISKRISNEDTVLHTVTGTPSYIAPEILHYLEYDDEDENESDIYTNVVDTWSFGCIIYEIMALQVPFPKYPQDLKKFCKLGLFPERPLTERTSKEGIEFIKSVLISIPSLRPSVKEVMKASWLQLEDIQASTPIINDVHTRESSFESPPASVLVKVDDDTEHPKVTIHRLTEEEREAYDKRSLYESDVKIYATPRRRHRHRSMTNEGGDLHHHNYGEKDSNVNGQQLRSKTEKDTREKLSDSPNNPSDSALVSNTDILYRSGRYELSDMLRRPEALAFREKPSTDEPPVSIEASTGYLSKTIQPQDSRTIVYERGHPEHEQSRPPVIYQPKRVSRRELRELPSGRKLERYQLETEYDVRLSSPVNGRVNQLSGQPSMKNDDEDEDDYEDLLDYLPLAIIPSHGADSQFLARQHQVGYAGSKHNVLNEPVSESENSSSLHGRNNQPSEHPSTAHQTSSNQLQGDDTTHAKPRSLEVSSQPSINREISLADLATAPAMKFADSIWQGSGLYRTVSTESLPGSLEYESDDEDHKVTNLKERRDEPEQVEDSVSEAHKKHKAVYPSPLRYVPYTEPAPKSGRPSSPIYPRVNRPSESPPSVKRGLDKHAAHDKSRSLDYDISGWTRDEPVSDASYEPISKPEQSSPIRQETSNPPITSNTKPGRQEFYETKPKKQRSQAEHESFYEIDPGPSPQHDRKARHSQSRRSHKTLTVSHLNFGHPIQVRDPIQDEPRERSLWGKTTDYFRSLSSQHPKSPASVPWLPPPQQHFSSQS